MPLLVASAMGRGKVVALLLDKGADPNAVAADGFTALHYAARRRGAGAVTIVTALLAHGARPDVRLRQPTPTAVTPNGVVLQGATALALAAEINNLDTARALVAGGADPLIPTEQNTTPLMLAAGAGTDTSRPRSLEERAIAVHTVRFLVEHGADVNAAGQFGWTALHAAAYQGLNDVIEYLASKGANLDAKDSFGQTPLSIAYAIITEGLKNAYYQTARSRHGDTAELLLRLGATPLERSGIVAINQRAGE
jgi:ankyrin repeat protein